METEVVAAAPRVARNASEVLRKALGYLPQRSTTPLIESLRLEKEVFTDFYELKTRDAAYKIREELELLIPHLLALETLLPLQDNTHVPIGDAGTGDAPLVPPAVEEAWPIVEISPRKGAKTKAKAKPSPSPPQLNMANSLRAWTVLSTRFASWLWEQANGALLWYWALLHLVTIVIPGTAVHILLWAGL